MIARILRRAAIGIAALGMLAPPTLLVAAEPPTPESPQTTDAAVISDVALGANGTLRGQVVDAACAAVPGVNIIVRQQDNVLARTTTNPAGKFEIVGLSIAPPCRAGCRSGQPSGSRAVCWSR